jgi:hypothetical protein
MVSEVIDTPSMTLLMIEMNDKEVIIDAWKVVGSPARRASINPSTEEDLKDFNSRASAASIPGFGFQVDAEGPPPPGFDSTSTFPSSKWSGGNNIWGSSSPMVSDVLI